MADTPDLGKLWKQLTDSVSGGVSDVISKLKDSSIGEQVQSWIGKGENKPVTADQVTDALGQDRINQMAEQAGTTPDEVAQTVAQHLPTAVDQATPDGMIPDAQSIKDNAAGAMGKATSMASDAMSAIKDKMPGMGGGSSSS